MLMIGALRLYSMLIAISLVVFHVWTLDGSRVQKAESLKGYTVRAKDSHPASTAQTPLLGFVVTLFYNLSLISCTACTTNRSGV